METETPLDVLSRAASLVDNNEVRRSSSSCSFNNDKPRSICERSSSFSTSKELPTKIMKQRRKDNRNADYLSAKLRLQRSSDSHTLVQRSQDPASSDEDSVPSYSSGTLDLEDSSAHEDDDDNEMPLDMTTTNRQTPAESVNGRNTLRLAPSIERRFYARPTIQIGPGTVQQQHRPSVIKCASALAEPHHGRSHRPVKSDSDKRQGSEVRHGHRREILSGMCDPVIDEHFRRSLGKDYPEYFSTPSVPNTVSVSGLSVDDHFAKALGDTWLRLQKSNRSDSGTSAGSSSSLSPPPSPPLVQQLHVVST